MTSRRDVLRLGGAFAGIVAVLAVLVVVGRLTSTEQPASPPSTSIDRQVVDRVPTDGVVAQVATGSGIGPLVFADDILWAGAWSSRQVVRIDPSANRVTARFDAGGENPTALAVGEGSVWILHPDKDEVVRLDARTGRIVARIMLGPLPFELAPGDRRFVPFAIAVGAGSVWVDTARGAVARIDSASNRVVATVRLAANSPAGMAVGYGAVWVAAGGGGLASMDARTGRLRGVLRLPIQAEQVTIGSDGIWVAGAGTGGNLRGSGVVRVDPTGHRITQDLLPDSEDPTGLAIGLGAVWRTEPTAALLVWNENGHQRAAAGPHLTKPWGIAVGVGGVWIANSQGRFVFRVDPSRLEG